MAAAADGPSAWKIRVDSRGRVRLPAAVRRQVGLKEGSELILTVEKLGVLRLVSTRRAAAAGMGLLRAIAGDRSLAEELIAERRGEVRRD